MDAFTHPHLAMQVPWQFSTAELLALYAECAPWCETATLKAMQKELTRRGVTPPAISPLA